MRRPTHEELQAGLARILESPKDRGTVEMIVRRPAPGEREVLESAQLDVEGGLVGDNWKTRGSRRTADGSAHPDMQLNIMNARVVAMVAGSKDRWPLAGDQLFLDLDLGRDNLPAGTRLQVGTAIVEVTPPPHAGCKKFVERYGLEAMKFVNSAAGRKNNLRGINAKVVRSGEVRTGDPVTKLP